MIRGLSGWSVGRQPRFKNLLVAAWCALSWGRLPLTALKGDGVSRVTLLTCSLLHVIEQVEAFEQRLELYRRFNEIIGASVPQRRK